MKKTVQKQHYSKSKNHFLLGTTICPKAENEPYKGDYGNEGSLDQPHSTEWYLKKMIEEKQGNLVVFWGSIGHPEKRPKLMKYWKNGHHLLKLAEEFKKNDLALMAFYSQGHHGDLYLDKKVVKQLRDNKELIFLGENYGEYLNHWFGGGIPENNYHTIFENLEQAKSSFINQFVRPKIKNLKKIGYPRVLSTSSHAFANYELEAGVDIPLNENVRCSYNISEMRGACKKWQREMWGLYINHDWYTKHIPYQAEQKYLLLKTVLYQVWMSGASIITLESGNLWTEAGHYTKNSDRNYPFEHKFCRKYRKTIRDFYEFTLNHHRDERGPIVKTCFALGNLDGFSGNNVLVSQENKFTNHRYYTFGLRGNARNNFNYLYGDPEYGWDIFFKTVYPLNKNALAPFANKWLSGTPFGPADVVCVDEKVGNDLLADYNLLIYTGWNTMTAKIYKKLCNYVKQGGTLLMALPHLSTRNDREYWNYNVSDIVKAGDISELFDIKIKGKGRFITSGFDTGIWNNQVYPFYDYDVENESGLAKITVPDFTSAVLLAEIETGNNAEILYKHDNRGQFKQGECHGQPLFIRNKLGKGTAYLTTAWDYPGAPGLKNVYAHIVKNLLFQHKNDIYLRDIGSPCPGKESSCIYYALYKKVIYLLNTDCQSSHSFELVTKNEIQQLNLAPTEFRIVTLN